jgi:hypothetical protein
MIADTGIKLNLKKIKGLGVTNRKTYVEVKKDRTKELKKKIAPPSPKGE